MLHVSCSQLSCSSCGVVFLSLVPVQSRAQVRHHTAAVPREQKQTPQRNHCTNLSLSESTCSGPPPGGGARRAADHRLEPLESALGHRAPPPSAGTPAPPPTRPCRRLRGSRRGAVKFSTRLQTCRGQRIAGLTVGGGTLQQWLSLPAAPRLEMVWLTSS